MRVLEPAGPGDGAAGLPAFFRPGSVAVIGAARDPSKVGGSVLANLLAGGFQGRIVPVNPRATTVQGLPAVPSLLAVDGSVDLAVIAVPAPAVLPALQDCVTRGVGGAIVISAGFRESDADGRAREEALRSWVRGQPIRVLGPNCLGWIRPSSRLNATFAPGMPLPGGIAFVSHSGALATAILDWARDRRLGFSLFASLGNQADLTESDVLAALGHDPETRVVAAYVEGVADGRRFFETLRAMAARTPVVVMKAGRSAEGARAVASHTGALAGSDAAFDAAVRQAGAVRVGTVEGLFDLARCLASQPMPRGRRLLVVTNGGGLGIVATDAARAAGLEVGPLEETVQARVRGSLPLAASVVNPIDLVGDADAGRYARTLQAVGAEGGADAVLVIATAQAATDAAGIARAVVGATREWPIPVVASFVGGARIAPGTRALEEGGVPCYPFPEPAVAALAGMALLGERRRAGEAARAAGGPRIAERLLQLVPGSPARPSAPPAAAGPARATLSAAGASHVGLAELAPLLAAYDVSVLLPALAETPEEAAAIAERLGGPVALKIASAEISHKTEIGGVALDLASPAAVATAARTIMASVRRHRPDARIQGLLVQAMAPRGKELLLGSVRDPQFGPVVVVGLGGIYVEVLRDTATRLAPLSASEAERMLDELRMAPLLHGVRGEPPVDRRALVATIVRFGDLVAQHPELAELELNPLIATPTGVVAVDARATLSMPGDVPPHPPATRPPRGATAAESPETGR